MARVILDREESAYMVTADACVHDEQMGVFYLIEITII